MVSQLFIDKVWCVHSGVATKTPRNLCDTWDGTAYATKLSAEQKLSSKSSESISHLVWCGEIKPSVGIRWVWRNTRASCIESGGTVIAADDKTKAHAEEAYDSMLADLNDPYVDCFYSDDILNVTSGTEKQSVCESKGGSHSSGNLIWCGKSFKKSCSEEIRISSLTSPDRLVCKSAGRYVDTSRNHQLCSE